MTAIGRAEPTGGAVPATRTHGRLFPLRLDPRTKLLLMGVVAIAELMDVSNYFTASVAAVPVILLAQNRQWRLATWYIALFALAILAQTHQGRLGVPMPVNMIFVLLTGFVLRLAPSFAMAAYFVASTTATELVTALSRMGISRTVTIPLSVVFRFVPTVAEEFASINDAMRMRGLRLGSGRFWRSPAALVEYRFVPLVASLATIGNELSAAALTRGLERPGTHTSIAEVGVTRIDVVVLLLTAAGLTTAHLAA